MVSQINASCSNMINDIQKDVSKSLGNPLRQEAFIYSLKLLSFNIFLEEIQHQCIHFLRFARFHESSYKLSKLKFFSFRLQEMQIHDPEFL